MFTKQKHLHRSNEQEILKRLGFLEHKPVGFYCLMSFRRRFNA